MTKALKIFPVLLALILNSCGSSEEKIEGEFVGFWAESTWIYKFQKDGSFIFETGGHVGQDTSEGSYMKNQDFVYLIPNSDWFEEGSVLRNELRIINSCIRDYQGNYYCKSEDELTSIQNREIEYQNEEMEE